jgi:heme exporter protein D
MWLALGIPVLIMVLALAMESVEARVIRRGVKRT